MNKRISLSLAVALMVSVSATVAARADGLVPPDVTAGCALRKDHLFIAPTYSPQWLTDSNDQAIDLVQFYLHGPLSLIQAVLGGQGWVQALPQNVIDDVAYGEGIFLGVDWIVQRMPVSAEFLCGLPMVDAWEKDNNPLGGRRHLRIFSVGQDSQGRSVWAVSASRDTGIRVDPLRPEQLFINHSSEPDEDLERDRVLQDLENADAIASFNTLTLAPTGYAQDNGAYSGDGRVYDIVIH